MDVFMTKDRKTYEISEKEYSLATKGSEIYIKRLKDNKYRYHAICPLCENPIQIIGLYKNTPENGIKPYGKHWKGSVHNLAEYNEENYYDCPFHNPISSNNKVLRSVESKLGKEIIRVLKENFDRVIYIINREIGLHISYALSKEMLKIFIANEGWLYRNIFVSNLPWMFIFSQASISLYGQMVRKDSDLYKAIEKNCLNVKLTDAERVEGYSFISNKDSEFIILKAFVYDHKYELKDNHLTETFEFALNYNNNIVFSKKITVDQRYFRNLIEKNDTYRNHKLLDLAFELIGEIK